MDVDVSWLRFWLDVLQWVVTCIIGVAMFAMRRHRGTVAVLQSESKGLSSAMQMIDSRLTRLEVQIEHAPSRRDIEQLSQRIQTLHGDLSKLSGGLEGIRRAVDLLNEHLLNRERER